MTSFNPKRYVPASGPGSAKPIHPHPQVDCGVPSGPGSAKPIHPHPQVDCGVPSGPGSAKPIHPHPQVDCGVPSGPGSDSQAAGVAWVEEQETREETWHSDWADEDLGSVVLSDLPSAATPDPRTPAIPVLDRAVADVDLLDDGSRRRSKTIARKQMLRERRRMLAQGTVPEILEYDRPVSRSACREDKRPCLYVSCRYHLYLDVNPATGSIKLNFPDKEVWDLEETCALDVAERGGITLEEVGEIMNLTRERIRQVEVSGLEKLKDGDAALHTFIDGRELEPSPPPKVRPAPKPKRRVDSLKVLND